VISKSILVSSELGLSTREGPWRNATEIEEKKNLGFDDATHVNLVLLVALLQVVRDTTIADISQHGHIVDTGLTYVSLHSPKKREKKTLTTVRTNRTESDGGKMHSASQKHTILSTWMRLSGTLRDSSEQDGGQAEEPCLRVLRSVWLCSKEPQKSVVLGALEIDGTNRLNSIHLLRNYS
jgi:hypothetical protein